MKLEDIHLVHLVPGRARFRIDGLKGDVQRADAIHERIASLEGIHEVEVNLTTGSVLIFCDASCMASPDFHIMVATALGISVEGLTPDQVAAWYAGQGDQASPNGNLRSTVEQVVGAINADVAQMTGNLADLRVVIPFALAILGVRSLIVTDKAVVPSWYNYFWFAFSTFFILNQHRTTDTSNQRP
jgi:hypothetical protein